jgi:hypothetical protein
MAKHKKYDDDDGRTVADMSGVERPGGSLLFPRFPEKEKTVPSENETASGEKPWENGEMSKEERRSFVLGAMSASALIAGVFIAAGAIFIAIIVFLSK